MVAAAPRLPVDALVDALVDAGRLDRARAVIGRMALPRRITRLLALPAPDRPADPDRVARLLAVARSIDVPRTGPPRCSRSSPLSPRTTPRQPTRSSSRPPTRWRRCRASPSGPRRGPRSAAYVHAGSVTAAVGLARRLVEWEAPSTVPRRCASSRWPCTSGTRPPTPRPSWRRPRRWPGAWSSRRSGPACARRSPRRSSRSACPTATTVAVGLPEWGRREVDAAVARQLAGSGRVQAALDLLPPPRGPVPSGAHLAVLTALLDVGEKERAVALARTITQAAVPGPRPRHLAGRPPGDPALASGLALLRSSTERAGRPEVDEAVARALVGAGLEDVLLEHLRDGWAHTIDTFTLTQLFDPVTALLPRHPELARSLAVAERDAEQVLTAL